jgi:ubiquinone/menaquinone biosynthesis C-methylase UbiE
MDGSVFNQTEHAMMAARDHDNAARQKAVRSCRQSLLGRLSAGSRDMYYKEFAPAYEAEKGHAPKDWRDIHDLMTSQTYVQFQLGFHRVVQELMWHTLVDSVEPQAKELAARAVSLDRGLGSLELDPTLEPPRYLTAVDIHCQPGGYCHENFAGDVTAGAIYDRAINMYQSGRGGLTDFAGKQIIAYLDKHFPGFAPSTILEMGCTVGHSIIAFANRYPEAEITGIDVGAPLLRYAHARAESLGKKVHFSQQNAERTKFPDASFDLVFSHILAHETSTKAWPAIIKECHRLLKPGGITIHMDLPQFGEIDPYRQFIYSNETYYNNEPFWTKYRAMNDEEVAIAAGFKPENVIRDFTSVHAFRDKEKRDAAIAVSRSLGHGTPPGSNLGFAFLVAVKD